MKLIISLKSIKWIAQSTKTFRSYQFLSIDRYNRYQSKSDYRQLSIYRLVFRYRFLAGIKCFSKTGLCKRQLKRGLQCQNGHWCANSCTHAPPHALVIRQPIRDILEIRTENQAHILLAEARQSNLKSGTILAVLIHSLSLFSFRLARRNVITKRNENWAWSQVT